MLLMVVKACSEIKDLQVFIVFKTLHKFLPALNDLWFFLIHCYPLFYFFRLLPALTSVISWYFVCG